MELSEYPNDSHHHVFLGSSHERNERKTWGVIILCAVMMLVEIVGGTLFGSLALVADGLHMSTHAGAMLIAALAYTYARRHATDSRFVFGTGKLGDLAGFSSAIVLAMIAVLIGYEAVVRVLHPVAIDFNEAIPIAGVGLLVNIASAWMLGGADHHGGTAHEHSHTGHSHSGHSHTGHLLLNPAHTGHSHEGHSHEGHAHHAHDHGARADTATTRDNSIRSAYVHVLADAMVSVLAITGLVLARLYGWLWMDPLAGIVGALVIANWSLVLIRDTAGNLLDVCPDVGVREQVRKAMEADGDRVVDLHLWRVGPGHLAAVVAVATRSSREPGFYKERLGTFKFLSHVTVEVTKDER